MPKKPAKAAGKKKVSPKAQEADNSAKNQRGRPFKPGQSGNPKGKPKGTRHKVTMLAEKLLDGECEGLVKKCIQMAMDGDTTAMKLVLDRILPPRKDRPISLDLPEIKKWTDILQAMEALTQAVARGEITPLEGQTFSAVLENMRKIAETTELEERMKILEKENR